MKLIYIKSWPPPTDKCDTPFESVSLDPSNKICPVVVAGPSGQLPSAVRTPEPEPAATWKLAEHEELDVLDLLIMSVGRSERRGQPYSR